MTIHELEKIEQDLIHIHIELGNGNIVDDAYEEFIYELKNQIGEKLNKINEFKQQTEIDFKI